MILVLETETFKRWLRDLRDAQAKARVIRRIDRLSEGNPGDVKPVGEGISEMRIDYGPGYRVCFLQVGSIRVLLLCGGDKRTQGKDIAAAKRLAKEWKDNADGDKSHGL
ncbi:type II toxin-antitoxin system RelE/ParE family toxin [Mesorhizobium captivum]|uniref:type II toxin-antitoxin system RelE/ParE family toxin n=1 Tax=Mesorhizobium captivum TaxID=3072319 RepID=UPI002A239A2B|nr:type II toxin-antitoxin system RelE/ParE family toxin [Mesorhizobium sp. VK23E]MDX8516336.1 type II toxin-antitoxin system RelE/ParE family toxin [Mesorhizobium sp. VK23E]